MENIECVDDNGVYTKTVSGVIDGAKVMYKCGASPRLPLQPTRSNILLSYQKRGSPSSHVAWPTKRA